VFSRAVFLDRDGVLNETFMLDGVSRPPATLADLKILPGVVEACARLRSAGFRLIVVTNQPDVARGIQAADTVRRLNAEVRRVAGIDDVFVCPHDDCDRCACRKPRPGLLLAAAKVHTIELADSVMVGDRDSDVDAGRAAGCRTVFVDRGYGRPPMPPADLTVASLFDAVPWIISQ
jgi:D-glycero-D-manno-heptose 1,7-bisphosphate phosphatase